MRKLGLICLMLVGIVGLSRAQKAYTQEGVASYYADKFHGRTTASGERYDKTKHTAAHRTLPFGTVVRVSNEETGQSTVVRINDRGPFVPNRIIDLSRAAAEDIDLIKRGTAKVKVEIVGKEELGKPQQPSVSGSLSAPNVGGVVMPPPSPSPSQKPEATTQETSQAPQGSEDAKEEFYSLRVQTASMSGYGVQIASYMDLGNLLSQASCIDSSLLGLLKVQVTERNGSKGFKLIIGTFASKSEANTYRARLQAAFPGCFVVTF